MKKIIGTALAVLMITGLAAPAWAEEKTTLIKPDFTRLTMKIAQELAAATVDGNQTYQEKVKAIKKEEDRLKALYPYDSNKEYDAKKELDSYKESLSDLKKSKRSQALDNYSSILSDLTQMKKSKNLLETAQLGLKARELEFNQGRITSDLLTQSKASVAQAETGLKNAEISVDLAYNRMNTLLKFQGGSRYEVDLSEIMEVVGEGTEAFPVPQNLDSEKWKEFKQLKDMQKELEKKEKQLNIDKLTYSTEEYMKNVPTRTIEIEDTKKDIKEKREDLYRSMTQSYSLGVNQMQDLERNYQTLQLAKLRYELDLKTFKLGGISKLQLLQKEGVYLDAKNQYEGQVVSLYRTIESYNKTYDPDKK